MKYGVFVGALLIAIALAQIGEFSFDAPVSEIVGEGVLGIGTALNLIRPLVVFDDAAAVLVLNWPLGNTG